MTLYFFFVQTLAECFMNQAKDGAIFIFVAQRKTDSSTGEFQNLTKVRKKHVRHSKCLETVLAHCCISLRRKPFSS